MFLRCSRKTWWSTLILAAVTLLVSVAGIATWHVADMYADELELSPENIPATASCLASLLTGDPKAEAGDMVFLNDVKLRPGPNTRLFIAIGAKGEQLLVKWDGKKQTGQPTPIVVDIKGIIRQMPTPRILHTEWLLSKKEIAVLGRQNVYIAAESVRQD